MSAVHRDWISIYRALPRWKKIVVWILILVGWVLSVVVANRALSVNVTRTQVQSDEVIGEVNASRAEGAMVIGGSSTATAIGEVTIDEQGTAQQVGLVNALFGVRDQGSTCDVVLWKLEIDQHIDDLLNFEKITVEDMARVSLIYTSEERARFRNGWIANFPNVRTRVELLLNEEEHVDPVPIEHLPCAFYIRNKLATLENLWETAPLSESQTLQYNFTLLEMCIEIQACFAEAANREFARRLARLAAE